MQHQSHWNIIFIWVTIFSIAMGFLESAVVVYLREIYYPQGFNFPLAPIVSRIAFTELGRELATLIMLVTIGLLAGKTGKERFAYFLYSFAIWDIFYYVFLKWILNWPESILTWDILFLIPVTWTSPVLAPVIVSVTMIVLAVLIIFTTNTSKKVQIDKITWLLFILGSLIIILSFIWDYTAFVVKNHSLLSLWSMPTESVLFEKMQAYIPGKFNWGIFMVGELFLCGGIYRVARCV